MEEQIHILEQEAYCAVLRAFKAQSDAISWEKESMITELRKELRVSDDEHRVLLNNVHSDDIIRSIRDWRQGGGNQAVRHANNQSLDVLPSRKKQKTVQSHPSISVTRNRSFSNRVVSAAVLANEQPEALIGRRFLTRWPDDHNFYAAVVTQYNADKGLHALVYDINTKDETWEWVDLKEIPPEDIKWEGEENEGTLNGGGTIHGNQRTLSNGGIGRGPRTQPRLATQNGGGRKFADDEIELFNTDSLVREVERVFDSNLPDPLELDKAKKLLKEHEQALIAAIARLADASDFESDGEDPYSHELPMPRG